MLWYHHCVQLVGGGNGGRKNWGVELAAKAGAHSSVRSARGLELNVVLGLISAGEQTTRLEVQLLHGYVGASGHSRLGLIQSNSVLGRKVLLFSLIGLLRVLHH